MASRSMGQHAFVVGGTGQVGRAVALRLANAGWSVTVASRGRYPNACNPHDAVRMVTLDRSEPGALAELLPNDVDVLIDLIAYDAGDAQQLLEVAGRVGSLIVLSTAGVYADGAGRNLQTVSDGLTGFPEFPVAIREDRPTVSADDASFAYAAGKVALEQTLLDRGPVPVTVIRPGAIHGPGSIYAREWWVVNGSWIDARRFCSSTVRTSSTPRRRPTSPT